MEFETQLKRLKKAYEEPHMSERQIEMMKQTIQNAKHQKHMNTKKKSNWPKGVAIAAAMAAFVILPNTSASVAHAMEQIPAIGRLVKIVTFRDYIYESERNEAHIEVPEIAIDHSAAVDKEVPDTLQQSVNEMNAEIQKLSNEFIENFEQNLEKEQGYQNIGIESEIINTTEDYFTLKLICYQASGSGTEWNYYYTIDLNTGERLALSELFIDNADYITPISENIKVQMAERMASDDKAIYWLNHEIEDWNFKQITDETAFYVNENGNIVISFNEGDVAPMYMGVVTFEIPAEVISEIRK